MEEATGTDRRARQPYLHDLVSCVRAPMLALSAPDGQIGTGVEGVYAADRRVLSRLTLAVNGERPAALRGQGIGAAESRFVGVVRAVGYYRPDPSVLVERHRSVTSSGMQERLRFDCSAPRAVELSIELGLECDLAPLLSVKGGGSFAPLEAEAEAEAEAEGAGLRWGDGQQWVSVRCEPPPARIDPVSGQLGWDARLEPAGCLELILTLSTGGQHQPGATAAFTAADPPWSAPQVNALDPRVPRVVEQGLADLGGLLLADGADSNGGADGADVFAAAGSPWFFTLFGRDSLWAAHMMLPLGTELAMGTLRALARRQGRVENLAIEEQPGKILHEVRREVLVSGDLVLPPLYYGSVDATPLWVRLLADAWRWGADAQQVAALLPAAERALSWMREFGDARGNGFLEYVDHLGTGLGNQGWKDSSDGVQWRDGRPAEAPVALCEVQGYAYAAAMDGAELLDAFGRPGADEWRRWARALQERFRERFWVEDEVSPYPAVALDGELRAVNSLTSNIGHLLGTGILAPDEAAVVARRLAAPDMDSGFGLRTLSARCGGFAPLSYHGGTVWPHDTAIVVDGLARAGHDRPAGALAAGILAAAPAFDYRLPELYGGEQADGARLPLPYPASCRPQAWAAAAPVLVLAAVLGVRPHVPRGELAICPLRPSPLGALEVHGLRVGGAELDLAVTGEGELTVLRAPAGLRLVVP